MTRHHLTVPEHLVVAIAQEAEGNVRPGYLAACEDLVCLTPHDTPEGRCAALLVALAGLPAGDDDRQMVRIRRVLENSYRRERSLIAGDAPPWLEELSAAYTQPDREALH